MPIASQTMRRSTDIPTVMKNSPSNSPLNGAISTLDLMAVFGLRQQHAGEKCAERG